MNNRLTAGKIQLVFTMLVVVFAGAWICSITIKAIMFDWLQWSSGLLALVSLVLFMFGGYYYVEISKPDDHFEIKFYNIFPFSREFKMYRIPISAFIKYEVHGASFFRRKLLLFQMSASQLAKYPPIYITACSKNNDAELERFFKHLKDN